MRSKVRTAALKTTGQGTRAALTQRDTERFSMLGSDWLRLDSDSGIGPGGHQRGTDPAGADVRLRAAPSRLPPCPRPRRPPRRARWGRLSKVGR
ncbi:hypothetical protein ACIP6X_34325 [Streptomyces coeruleorubidus]|uniref:hypothetical protein n=1 Tax=Streptomyces coeruleorubidus TaxID=116188 RepID=UPI0037FA8380